MSSRHTEDRRTGELLASPFFEMARDVMAGLVPHHEGNLVVVARAPRSGAVMIMSGPSAFTIWKAFAGAMGSRSTRTVRSQSRFGVSWRHGALACGPTPAGTRV